jgi:hypothetical protein
MNAPIETRERPILFGAEMVRAILAGTKTQTRRIVTKPISPNMYAAAVKGVPAQHEANKPGLHRPDLPADATLMHAGSGKDRRVVASTEGWERECPYGVIGDRLYVRETHAVFQVGADKGTSVAYRATCRDDGTFDYVSDDGSIMGLTVTKWTPAIHMPRWASRITLEITEVRVERLQDISGEDARAEGVQYPVSSEGCPDGFAKPLFKLGSVVERAIEWGIYPTPSKPKLRDATHDDLSRLYFADLWDSINGKRPGCSWRDNPWLFAISFKRVEARS